ncbi:MAG: Ig-like domain-containing protein [Pseudomonadota bacterium]
MSNTGVGRHVRQTAQRVCRSIVPMLSAAIIGAFLSGTAHADALWVAESEGTTKLDAVTGSVLLQLPEDPYGTGAVGVDHTNGNVWTWGEQRLRGFDAAGVNFLDIESASYPFWQDPNDLVVDGVADRIWVNLNTNLLLLDMSGQILDTLVNYGSASCNSMTLDPQRSRLWLCSYSSIKAYNSNMQEVVNIAFLPADVICRSAWDPFHDELWVATSAKIRRYDADGQMTFDMVNPAASAGNGYTYFLKPDGQGGVWIGNQTQFWHMDAAGTVSTPITPYSDYADPRVRDAAAYTADGSIWIARDAYVRRFSTAGAQLHEQHIFVGGKEHFVQNMELFLAPAGNGPIAANDTGSTNEDTAVVLNVLSNDTAQVGTLDPASVVVTNSPMDGATAVDAVLGTVTYTPDADYNGTDAFQYVVSDDQGNVSAPATVTLDVLPVNDVPVADDLAVNTVEEDPVAVVLSGRDVDPDTLTFAVAVGPTDGVLTGTAPNLTYTPDANFNGTDSFTYTANDGTVDSLPATVTINVAAANDLPVADDQQVSTPEDTPLAVTLTATDLDSDPLTYAVQTDPVNGVLSGTAPNLTYTPNPNFNGADSFSFIADDATGPSAPATITIDVTAVNDVPVADNLSVNTNEDIAVAVTLSGSDIEGSPLTFAVVAGPTSGVLSGTAPNLTYTPNADYNGGDSFTYTVNDGTVDSAIATVTLTIAAVNDLPIANAASLTTAEDTSVPVTLTGSDPEGAGLTYTVAMGPMNGSLSGTAPNLTYTPNANYFGGDSLTFTVNDGTDTSVAASITLVVTLVNDLPVANDLTIDAIADVGVAVPLSGSDIDGDALTFAVTAGPSNGVLSGPTDNLVYTANTAYVGSDSLTYTANDGTGASAPATVTFNVTTNNSAPVITSAPVTTATTAAAYSYQVVATDADLDPLTYFLADGPAGMGITSGGLVEWATPTVGAFPVVVQVSDGNGGLAEQPYTLTVIDNAAPEFVQIPAPNAPLGEAYRSVGRATDPDGDVVTLSLTNGPAGAVLNDLGDGRFELVWTASGSIGDVEPFTVTATDPAAASATLNLAVTVTGSTVNRTHLGTDFWLAYALNFSNISFGLGQMPLDDPGRRLQVIVGAPDGANGTVTIANLGFSQAFSLLPGETATIDLPNETQVQRVNSSLAEGGAGGVNVVSDTPVTVAGVNWAEATTDAWLALPTPALGSNYLVTGFLDNLFNPSTDEVYWGVLAVEDNTTFTATPIGTIPERIDPARFDPITFTLDRGEYYVRSTDYAQAVQIVTDRPAGVFGGSSCANVPEGVGFCEHLWQQFVPENTLASEYVAAPMATRTASLYRVIATEDDTLLYLNGVYSARLDRGESIDSILPGAVSIRGSRPIVAVQYALGDEYDDDVRGNNLADPFMLNLAPADTFLSRYTLVVPNTDGIVRDLPGGVVVPPIENHYLSIVIPAAAAGSLTLDGVIVDTSGFEPVPESDHVAGNLDILPGTYQLEANDQFGVTVYGFGYQESYGYYAGLIFPDGASALDLGLTGPAGPLVAGSEEACIGIVTSDIGGARVPRARYRLDITGVLPSSNVGFTNSIGEAEFCYTQPGPGTDTVTVTINGDTGTLNIDWLADTDPGTNGAPRIVSLPELVLYEAVYNYPLTAVDPDNDTITYTVADGPAGATIAGGALVWTPPIPDNRQPTRHRFDLVADDGNGGTDTQSFEIDVFYPAIFVEPFPVSRSFETNYTRSFDHLGGDPNLLIGEMIEGEGSVLYTRFLGSSPTYYVDGQTQLIQQPEYTDALNIMCRAPAATLGQLRLREVWEEDTGETVDAGVAGPVLDSNNDGVVDNADHIYAALAERDSVALYNITTRELVWRNTGLPNRGGSYAAIVNVDADIEAELLFVHRTGSDNTHRLTAYNADGSVAWRSAHAPLTGDYSSASRMPILPVDLDADGVTEILYGPYVYDNNGSVLWQFDTTAIGSRSRQGLPLAVDLDQDGVREVLFQDEVRDANGNLLWSLPYSLASRRPQVFYAAADLTPDPGLEVVASISTASGVFHEAFTADGTRLWADPITTIGHGLPLILDFDRDGNVDILLPEDKALVTVDGRVVSTDTGVSTNVIPTVTDFDRDGLPEVHVYRNSSFFEFDDLYSRQEWARFGLSQTNRLSTSQFWQSVMWIDPDHDGETELFIAGSFELGLYESIANPLPLASRRYSQVIDFEQPVIGFDTDWGTPGASGIADAWIGEISLDQLTEQNFSFSVEVRNKGLQAINEPMTVEFYSGRVADNILLGTAVIPSLEINEVTSVAIPVTFDDRAAVMSARVVPDAATAQCETGNDAVEGQMHTIELRDGLTAYRSARRTYVHQRFRFPGSLGIAAAPPSSTIQLGQTYTFDADSSLSGESTIGNGVWFGLSSAAYAAGARVNSTTGEITWTPTVDDLGSNSFSLSVFSTGSGSRGYGFTVTVEPRPNDAPVITTLPPAGTILAGDNYVYDVDATDADSDTLFYELTQAPAGMTIDPATGVIDWQPTLAQTGANAVTVSVDDRFGGIATQAFTIAVNTPGNESPEITSTPPFSAKATFAYQYQIVASDPDSDPLVYTLEDGPAGMAVDAAGLLTWTPTAAGFEAVRVRVSDGSAFVDQGWNLTISDADIPLVADVSASPATVEIGEPVSLVVGYSGAAGLVNISLTVDGVSVPVDAAGTATFTPPTVGTRLVTAIVSDPYASDSASTTFTAIDSSLGSVPPVVSLTTPDFEEEVTAPRDAIGSVTDPDDDLLRWFLALQRRGAPPTEFTILAEGTGPVTDDVLGQIDPSMLMNGLYTVILEATDLGGNVAQDTRVIRVTGDLKVGNFSITFEDFSAPVAGIPVTVLRTYDTRQRVEELDFGYGWSVDYQNVRLQESRDIGFSWSLIEEDFGLFSQWCVRPNGDPTVTVRLPDGEVETFVARAVPECTQFVPTVDVNIAFTPIDGTDSTLEQRDFGNVRIIGNNIVDLGSPDTPIDPDSYRLTTPEGFVYELDQGFGVRRVIDTHGNTLTYSDTGIVHSQGFALDFIRDAQGRIESIVAPDGSSMAYGYDVNGDLTSYTDAENNVTTFTYTNATDHYLEDIIDPRGIRVSRNEYDADGRLIAIIDADGNRVEYTHDIIGRTETIRDRRNNTTVYVYDDEGNVLVETNALNETTTRTYDDDRNVLTETNDLGEVMTWTYDERGNVLTERNDLGETTTSTYDDRNLLLTVVDPLGLPVMTNVYNANNTNLETMTDALGQTTTFFWDSGIGGGCSTGTSEGSLDAENNRTTIQPRCFGPFGDLPAWEEDARGVRTTFGYDGLGRVTTETTTRTDEFGIEQTLVTTMVYDDKGRVTSVTDPEGNVTTIEYNGIDKEAATVDPELNRTEYEYDDRGNRILTRYADNTTETMAYDEEGNLISQTDRLGRTTRMVYDAANRLTETIYPDDTPGNDLDNPRTTNEYDGAGRLTASIDERGNRTEYEYDRAGRQVLIRNALLEITQFEYDARGLRTAMIDALSRRTEYVYDDAGRLTETIFPDDTPGDLTDNLRMQMGYDAIGRKTSETDLAGLTTMFEYDGVGNLTAVIDALNQRTEYGYDEQ